VLFWYWFILKIIFSTYSTMFQVKFFIVFMYFEEYLERANSRFGDCQTAFPEVGNIIFKMLLKSILTDDNAQHPLWQFHQSNLNIVCYCCPITTAFYPETRVRKTRSCSTIKWGGRSAFQSSTRDSLHSIYAVVWLGCLICICKTSFLFDSAKWRILYS
jgi:hypothetical protein